MFVTIGKYRKVIMERDSLGYELVLARKENIALRGEIHYLKSQLRTEYENRRKLARSDYDPKPKHYERE